MVSSLPQGEGWAAAVQRCCPPCQGVGGCQLAAQQLHSVGEHLGGWAQQRRALPQLEQRGKGEGGA